MVVIWHNNSGNPIFPFISQRETSPLKLRMLHGIGRGKEYLNNFQTGDMMKRLNQYFECKVEIPRIKHGNRQTLETLINEEALLFAKYLRNERETWNQEL